MSSCMLSSSTYKNRTSLIASFSSDSRTCYILKEKKKYLVAERVHCSLKGRKRRIFFFEKEKYKKSNSKKRVGNNIINFES